MPTMRDALEEVAEDRKTVLDMLSYLQENREKLKALDGKTLEVYETLEHVARKIITFEDPTEINARLFIQTKDDLRNLRLQSSTIKSGYEELEKKAAIKTSRKRRSTKEEMRGMGERLTGLLENGSMEKWDITTKLGISTTAFYNLAKGLIESGTIDRVSSGRYAVKVPVSKVHEDLMEESAEEYVTYNKELPKQTILTTKLHTKTEIASNNLASAPRNEEKVPYTLQETATKTPIFQINAVRNYSVKSVFPPEYFGFRSEREIPNELKTLYRDIRDLGDSQECTPDEMKVLEDCAQILKDSGRVQINLGFYKALASVKNRVKPLMDAKRANIMKSFVTY